MLLLFFVKLVIPALSCVKYLIEDSVYYYTYRNIRHLQYSASGEAHGKVTSILSIGTRIIS